MIKTWAQTLYFLEIEDETDFIHTGIYQVMTLLPASLKEAEKVKLYNWGRNHTVTLIVEYCPIPLSALALKRDMGYT